MGGGESDAYYLKVTNTPFTNNSISTIDNNTTTHYCGTWCNHQIDYGVNWSYSWTTTIYMYQVKCPKRGCKTFNWIQLDKITPCTNCGSKLKAVSDSPDFTIPVG